MLIHSIDQAANWAQRHDTEAYIDAHAWTFVPASFSLIMLELAYLGLTDWEVERTQPAEYTEFYTSLILCRFQYLKQIISHPFLHKKILHLDAIKQSSSRRLKYRTIM